MLRHKVKNFAFFGSEELRIIHGYRFMSWFFTSLYYLYNDNSSKLIKLGVITILLISSIIIVEVYNKSNHKAKIEKSFVLVETIGISILILPTGGLDSPFIWYALNPVLISTYFHTNLFSWLNLSIYLSISTFASYFFFNTYDENLMQIIAKNTKLILIFLLTTLAVQSLIKLNNRLREQSDALIDTSNQLNKANIRLSDSLENIMSLYHTVEGITSIDNKSNMYQTLSDFTLKLTKSDSTFFYFKRHKTDVGTLSLSGNYDMKSRETLLDYMEKRWQEYIFSEDIIKVNLKDSIYNISPIRASSMSYGLIGFKIKDNSKEIEEENIKQLRFISNLSGVILERFEIEEVTERLIISEEQNRIANEMHDNVAQRLFSMSCATHTLRENFDAISSTELQEKLRIIEESTNATMKELRRTIYRLSTRKGAKDFFLTDIREYLVSISKLNNIEINFSVSGDADLVDISKKRGLYRIISEATGNSIRHSGSESINIDLNLGIDEVKLRVVDNGRGFEFSNDDSGKGAGLGLNNMKNLVEKFKGKFEIKSRLNEGTEISVVIPNYRI